MTQIVISTTGVRSKSRPVRPENGSSKSQEHRRHSSDQEASAGRRRRSPAIRKAGFHRTFCLLASSATIATESSAITGNPTSGNAVMFRCQCSHVGQPQKPAHNISIGNVRRQHQHRCAMSYGVASASVPREPGTIRRASGSGYPNCEISADNSKVTGILKQINRSNGGIRARAGKIHRWPREAHRYFRRRRDRRRNTTVHGGPQQAVPSWPPPKSSTISPHARFPVLLRSDWRKPDGHWPRLRICGERDSAIKSAWTPSLN